MDGRHYAPADGYRYGFQGQEMDDEVKGKGNSVNYKYRMHDPRIGRFFAVDPLTSKYPHYTPYQFSGNKVIHKIELEGLEEGDLPHEQEKYMYSNWKSMYENAQKKFISKVVELADNGVVERGPKLVKATESLLRELNYKMSLAVLTMDKFEIFGKTWASRNLGRYLVGEGGYDIYSVDYLNDYRDFRKLRDALNSHLKVKIRANEDVQNLKAGETVTIDISSISYRGQNEAIEGPLAPDYQLAIGSGHMLANGAVNVMKEDNGDINIWGEINYTFWDTYGWNPNLTSIPHTFYGMLNHQDAIWLEKGGAKVFKERSYFTGKVWWSSDEEIMFGSYQNASKSDKFSEPGSTDSVEGEELINDFTGKN